MKLMIILSMKYAKYIIYLSLIAFCLLTAAQWIYDPLQLFHKSFLHDGIYLNGNMRESARAVIDNYEFDSVILGSSMLENTSSKEAEKIFGGNFVNISLSGGNYAERALILNYLFRKKGIRRVIYSLDYCYERQRVRQPMPFLYNRTPFDDFIVYYRPAYLKCLSKWSKDGRCTGYPKDLDRPGAWMNNRVHNARFGGVENWKRHINGQNIDNIVYKVTDAAERVKRGETKSIDTIPDDIKVAVEYLEENLLEIIRANPETEFLLVFPPYSRANYAIWAQYEISYFAVYEYVQRYLAESGIDNMKVYGFDNVSSVADDIGRYKDLLHYHYSVNSEILNMIKQGDGLLSRENIEGYLFENRRNAENFDLSAFAERLK